MKTTTARNKGVLAMGILVLFMLSASAHAVRAQNLTTTTTTATSSGLSTDEGQCGDNETPDNDESETSGTTTEAQDTTQTTTTEQQTAVNEQSDTDDQCGDNVTVVELDQGEENQIQSAEADETIAGEVQVTDSTASATVADSRFNVVPTEGANGRLDVQVTGENVTGPRSFLITLSNSMNPTTHSLAVTLDGSRVSQASSIGQVLHPTTNEPSYVVVKSTSGYQLLVSVPHFSTHMLSIVPLAPGPSQGFFPISGITLAGVVIALTALIAVAFTKRKRIYTPLA